MPAHLSTAEVHAFLDSRPGWIVLTTIGRDGFPHSVPIGYFRIDEDVYIGCRAGTQKLKNIARNPRVSLLLEAGTSMHDIKGAMLQGTAEVIAEPEAVLRLMREAGRRRGTPEEALPVQPRPGTAYIRVRPEKVISWDYASS